jgi:hypothetical protein
MVSAPQVRDGAAIEVPVGMAAVSYAAERP